MFSIFTEKNSCYNKNKANALVIKIRGTKDVGKMNKYRMELFKMMSKIVVKNINNYLKLTLHSPVKDDSNNQDEMQSEAFIVLDNCVKNYKMKADTDFYFYFNSSLNRNFYRMFSELLRKNDRLQVISDYIKVFSGDAKNYAEEDVAFLVDQLGLTEMESRVLFSKVIQQSKQDFLKSNKKMDSQKYQICIANIKIVLTKFKDHGFNL